MLTNERFANIVADDVKNRATEAQVQMLRMPETLPRWAQALDALVASLDDQCQELDERLERERERYIPLGVEGVRLLAEVESDIDDRRNRVSRFRFYVEQRVNECEQLMRANGIETGHEPRDLMRAAVEEHRRLIIDQDLDYTEVDEALWAVLEGRWEFGDLDLDAVN